MDTSTDRITVTNTTTDYQIAPEKISRLAAEICLSLGLRDFELGVSLVDAEDMRELNREYRQKDRPTDVLSFPQLDWRQPLLVGSLDRQSLDEFLAAPAFAWQSALGDIVVCLAMAEENAHHIGQGLDRELSFLLVHGLLHLCGHDHLEATEEELMIKQQELLMARLTAQGTPPLWEGCVQPKAGTR